MIETIGVSPAARGFRNEGGGKVHGPMQRPQGGEVAGLVGDKAVEFGTIGGDVGGRKESTEARDGESATGTGHVMEAGAGVEMMAAAGAAADGGTLAAASSGKGVAASAEDVHGDLQTNPTYPKR
jgi:hypothetical protein